MPTHKLRPVPRGVDGTGLVGHGDRYARQDLNGADFQSPLLSADGVDSFNDALEHIACDNAPGVAPYFLNPGPDPLTLTASVDNGSARVPVRFGGLDSLVLAPGGRRVADLAPIWLPKADPYLLRVHGSVESGGHWPITHFRGSNNDRIEVGTGLDDKTMTGTIGIDPVGMFSAYQMLYAPPPGKLVPVIVTDSIGSASATDPVDNSFIRRAFTGRAPYLFAGMGSSTLLDLTDPDVTWPGTFAPMLAACNGSFQQRGTNDLFRDSASAATMIERLESVWDILAPYGPIYQATILPRSWTGSTPSGRNGDRVTVNSYIRASPRVTAVELADSVETARDSGIGVDAYFTEDKTHPSDAGADVLAAVMINCGIMD